MMHKTDAAIQLIRNALTAGIKAGYVLMDTWFTTEPMLKNILDTGIHAIGMVKQLQQRYTYNGRQYTLPGLKKFVDFSSAGNIFGSLVVTTKTNKISFNIKDRQIPTKVKAPGYVRRVDWDNTDFHELHSHFASITHGCLFRNALAWEEYWRWDEDDTNVAVYYNTKDKPCGFMVYLIKNDIMHIKETIWPYALERIEGKQEAVDRLDDVLYHKIPYISDYI